MTSDERYGRWLAVVTVTCFPLTKLPPTTHHCHSALVASSCLLLVLNVSWIMLNRFPAQVPRGLGSPSNFKRRRGTAFASPRERRKGLGGSGSGVRLQ